MEDFIILVYNQYLIQVVTQLETNDSTSAYEFTSIQTLFLFVLHKYPSITGSDIVSKIEKEIGNDWIKSSGTTYKILKKLLSAGCIEETTQKTNLTDGRKKTYKLTACGTSFVQQQADRMLRLVGFLNDCCPEFTSSYTITKVCDSDKCC